MNELEKAIQIAGQPLRITDEGFQRRYTFDADFIGFDGHFPNNPILPGVVQLMTGANAASEAAERPLTTIGVSRAKFLKPIGPDDSLLVKGMLKIKSETILATIKIFCEDEIAASFTLTMIEE